MFTSRHLVYCLLAIQLLVEGARPTNDIVQAAEMRPSGAMVRDVHEHSAQGKKDLLTTKANALLQEKPASSGLESKSKEQAAVKKDAEGQSAEHSKSTNSDANGELKRFEEKSKASSGEKSEEKQKSTSAEKSKGLESQKQSKVKSDIKVEPSSKALKGTAKRSEGLKIRSPSQEDVDSFGSQGQDVGQDDHDVNGGSDGGSDGGQGVREAFPEIDAEALASKDLFKNTVNRVSELKSAEAGIGAAKDKLTRAIDAVNSKSNAYAESIKDLSVNFAMLHEEASNVHSDLLTELKNRESKRMCALENVDRVLKGEPLKPCSGYKPSVSMRQDTEPSGGAEKEDSEAS